jgi:GTPase SAR1 family protein
MPNQSTAISVPLGFTLSHTLKAHGLQVGQIVWSSDGQKLAVLSDDNSIQIWDMKSRQLHRAFKMGEITGYSLVWSPDGTSLALGSSNKVMLLDAETGMQFLEIDGHSDVVNCLAWSRDGRYLASGADDKSVRLWSPQTGQCLWSATMGHNDVVNCLDWSPDGETLASGASDQTLILWDVQNGHIRNSSQGFARKIMRLAWSPDGKIIASIFDNEIIGLWDGASARPVRSLEGWHTSKVVALSFSADGNLLASKAQDGTICFWRCDQWQSAAIYRRPALDWWSPCLAFHPKLAMLATLSGGDRAIDLWSIDQASMLNATPAVSSMYYANAKVILLGDTGVGKSGLALVLTNQPFIATDSTHGRRVWIFSNQEVSLPDGQRELHETLLWDLAGQPGYRLVHQLHLREVVVALIVFDARSETDPFAGINYWNRALRQALNIQKNTALPLKKFLVAARVDRGGRSVSSSRIKKLKEELDVDAYFETSAKEGWGIAELAAAVRKAIDWEVLPKVSSTEFFQRIKGFLVAQKETGQVLLLSNNLYHAFLDSDQSLVDTEELRAQFEVCIGRVESQGLIRRLSFGNFILLQPELLDIYTSALVNAVKEEPDGLGSISEERAQAGDFRLPGSERIKDRTQEKLLLIAMVEDLILHEIALREVADDGAYLVFPAQSTREHPDLPDPEGKAIIFNFDGAILNIYASLAVRLSHSGMFRMKELWKDAVTYTARASGTCGILLHNSGEGRGELTLFFTKDASEETCFHFEEYIYSHLQNRALPESIRRWRIFVCSNCGESVPHKYVVERRKRGYDNIKCGVCEAEISLLDREERLSVTHKSRVLEMDLAADTRREREAIASVRQGYQDRNATEDFDVFLCHNQEDKSEVKKIGRLLKERGLAPWLDEWELRPGFPWQRLLEEQITHIKSVAVFVGKNGVGPWQHNELDAFLREFVRRGCPVIPVLLVDAPQEPALPVFLNAMTWVDFREQGSEPMERLIWGITGRRVTMS